jgi:Uma2 family endonuclease
MGSAKTLSTEKEVTVQSGYWSCRFRPRRQMQPGLLLTAEQFLQLPPQEGKRFELDEGELIERTFPTFKHNRIALRLCTQLESFLRMNPLGEVFPSDCGFKLSPATVRGPDVCFLTADRVRLLDPESNHFDGAPDLVVEIVSPSDSARDLQRKVDQYLKPGARRVWVIYPDTRQVHAFSSDGSVRRIGPDDDLEAPDVIPGFRIRVGELIEP